MSVTHRGHGKWDMTISYVSKEVKWTSMSVIFDLPDDDGEEVAETPLFSAAEEAVLLQNDAELSSLAADVLEGQEPQPKKPLVGTRAHLEAMGKDALTKLGRGGYYVRGDLVEITPPALQQRWSNLLMVDPTNAVVSGFLVPLPSVADIHSDLQWSIPWSPCPVSVAHIALGGGKYTEVEESDTATIVYQLHNPLSADVGLGANASASKCFTFRQLEHIHDALGLKLSRDTGLIFTELNLNSTMDDEVCAAAAIDHVLAFGTTDIVVFGRVGRDCWIEAAEARRKTGEWTDVQQRVVNGVHTISFVRAIRAASGTGSSPVASTSKVQVWLSVHPCVWNLRSVVTRAIASAHRVEVPVNLDAVCSSRTPFTSLTHITRSAEEPFLVTDISIAADTDADKRYVLANGMLTHNSSQIEHFGQTPSQLFTTPHPQRCTRQEQSEHEIPSLFQQMRDWQKLQATAMTTTGGIGSTSSSSSAELDASRLMLQLYTVEQITASAATENPLLFLALLPGTDRLLSIGLDRVMSLHKFKNTIQEYIPPFVLEVEKRKGSSTSSATWSGANSSNHSSGGSGLAGALSFMGGTKGSAGSGKRVGVHFTVGLNILPFFFLRSHDERFLLSAGHWDNCLSLDHEILTADGWLDLHAVLTRVHDPSRPYLDTVCFNPDTGALERHPITQADVPVQCRTQEMVDVHAGDNIAVSVTSNHNMWLRVCDATSNGDVSVAPDQLQWRKMTAGEMATELNHGKRDRQMQPATQFTGLAPSGIDLPAGTKPPPFIAQLSLETEDEITAFLELYGYWLGNGSLSIDNCALTFSPAKAADQAYLDDLFGRLQGVLPLCPSVDAGASGYTREVHVQCVKFSISHPAWWQMFADEYGHEYDGLSKLNPTAPSLWWWVIRRCRLNRDQLRAILRGLRFANGDQLDALNDLAAAECGRICTGSTSFRDELMELAMYAGYTVDSTCTHQIGSCVIWDVRYSSIAAHTIVGADVVTRVSKEVTWCVNVPEKHHLIVTRMKYQRDGRTRHSKPIMIGNSLRVTHIESGVGIQAISAHKDIVTCVAISEVGDYIVTGSKDTTTIVWQVADYVIDMVSHPIFAAMGAGGPAAASAAASAAAAGDLYLLESPLHVLYGHDDEVSCVSVSSDLNTVVSGSRDGTIMVHALRSGRYTRTITPPDRGAIRWVGISTQGTIISYSLLDLMLHAYTINGDVIGSADTGERLYCIHFSSDGEFLLCGGDRKQLSFYRLHPGGAHALQCVHRLPSTDATIRSIVLTPEEQHILVGTGTGKLYVYGLNADYLRKRFLKRLAHLGL
jgi:WD40 repeat protein